MKLNLVIIVATVYLALLEPINGARTDKTLVAGAKGSDVVEATSRKIRRSQIFAEDFDFIQRLAIVESKNGESLVTVNDGGIWQVNPIYLQRSQSSILSFLHSQIQSEFQITWSSVSFKDLLKPLYSALAARLYLATIPEEIPSKLNEQASFWLTHYNQRDATAKTFIDEISKSENGTIKCTGLMDLVVVMDSSGSVGDANFATASRFVASLFDTFSLESVRLSYIPYANVVDRVFDLDNGLTIEEIKYEVLHYEYWGGGTNTNAAILEAVETFTSASTRPASVPRVMTILTDGLSQTGVSNIQLAKEANISSFVIGVGPLIEEDELLELAYGDPIHKFTLEDFDVLTEFYQRLSLETCSVPQRPALNVTIHDQLNQNERRYFSFELPAKGLSVVVKVDAGSFTGYYSTVEDRPNSAFNDGIINTQSGVSYIFAGSSRVYVAIEGKGTSNNVYSITAYAGAI